MIDTDAKIQFLTQNGFVFFPNFVPSSTIEQARQELETWYAKDLAEREQMQISEAHHIGCSGHTILTEPSHLMIDVYGKSPTLDQVTEKILTDPHTSKVLKALAGENFNFYGYNIRRMTGSYDTSPAHEWHRDTPGEFGIGILLTDTPPDDGAATALVPGSHKFPYCPRWNTLFKESCRDYKTLSSKIKTLIHLLPFNSLLRKKIQKVATGASGKQGDIYFFINDVWHGRQPNLNGKQTMVMLIGSSPADIKLPHAVKMPPENFLQDLPPAVKKSLCERDRAEQTKNANTIIHELLKNRKKERFMGIFYLARLERKVFDWCQNRTKNPSNHLRKFKLRHYFAKLSIKSIIR